MPHLRTTHHRSSAYFCTLLCGCLFQITAENSPKVVANGHSFVDPVKETDTEANVSPIAINGTSAALLSERTNRNGDAGGQQEVVPVVTKNVAVADVDRVRQGGEATSDTATSTPLIGKRKTENIDANWYLEVAPCMENDVAEVDTLRQDREVTAVTSGHLIFKNKMQNGDMNWRREISPVAEKDVTVQKGGEIAAETKKQRPVTTKKHERETQIKSLQIDDDGEDEDVIEERQQTTSEDTSEGRSSGAEMFALGRPRAWHHSLPKKRHEAVDESTLDRQVSSSPCV